jgi:hypothetical protein
MSPQASWILQDQIVPRLRSAIPKSVLCVGAEDHQELIQDGIAMSARMLDRVERQGKLGKVTASNIGYYCLQHLKSGRRASGSSTVDIMGSATQLNGSVRLHSLNEVVSQTESGEEVFELHDVFSNDHDDPSVQAARRLDWSAFLATLSKAERIVVKYLYAGRTLRDAARKAGVCDSTMQYHKQRIAQKITDFMGLDILRDIASIPHWRIGLNCERELLACRAERRH